MPDVTERPLSVAPPLSGPIVAVAPMPATVPTGFSRIAYRHEWVIAHPRPEVWRWLTVSTAVIEVEAPPVEADAWDVVADRHPIEGCYVAHTAPLMSVTGVLATYEPQRYVDQQFFLGSRVGHRRFARPGRMQFWLHDGPGLDSTLLQVRIDADVRTRFAPSWERMMTAFWTRFGRRCAKATSAGPLR